MQFLNNSDWDLLVPGQQNACRPSRAILGRKYNGNQLIPDFGGCDGVA